MTYTSMLLTPGRGALIAALAVASTPALAQQAVPDSTQPVTAAPQSAPSTAPQPDPSPVPVTDVAPSADPAPANDPLAATAVTKATSTKAKASKGRPARAAAETAVATKPAPVSSKPATPVAAASSAPAANPAVPTAPVSPPVQLALAPVAQEPASGVDETPLVAGAAGAGLLMLGGAAYALSRRRRRERAEAWVEPAFTEANHVVPAVATVAPVITPDAKAPIEAGKAAAPVVSERSAFNWAKPAGAAAAPVVAAKAGDRIEQAYAGPTPDNPFLSLKKRLKRATFFDQRERMVAAGEARPVAPTAGLPERLVAKARATASAAANAARPPAAMAYGFSYAPA